MGLSYSLALRLLPSPLLDKASEGGQAGSGPDHDHRRLRSVGKPELRPPNEAGNLGARFHRLHPRRGDALVGAARLGRVLNDDGRDVDSVLVDPGGRRDGVESRLEPRQKFQKMIDCWKIIFRTKV